MFRFSWLSSSAKLSSGEDYCAYVIMAQVFLHVVPSIRECIRRIIGRSVYYCIKYLTYTAVLQDETQVLFIVGLTGKERVISAKRRGGPLDVQFLRQSDHKWRCGCSLTRWPSCTPQDDFWYSFVRSWVNIGAIARLKGLGQLTNPETS
jgi:hypothetical protein